MSHLDLAPLSSAPPHMRMLADWLDAKYPDDEYPQIQDDLRYWADLIEKLVGAIVDEAIERAGQPEPVAVESDPKTWWL